MDFQAKVLNKVGPEIEVVATNEKEGVHSQDKVYERKGSLGSQKSSFDILQTLQWAGGTDRI